MDNDKFALASTQNIQSQKDRELRMIQLLEQGIELLTRIARNTTPKYSEAVAFELEAKTISGENKE